MSQPNGNLPFLSQRFGPLRRKPWSAAVAIGATPLRPILCVAGRRKKKGCEHCQNCRPEMKYVHDLKPPGVYYPTFQLHADCHCDSCGKRPPITYRQTAEPRAVASGCDQQ